MHRITGLEGDDAGPAEAAEFGAQLGWRQAERAEIVVGRSLELLDFSAHVPWVRFVDDVIGAGMRGAGGIEHGLSFGFAIGLPDVIYTEDGEHDAFGIAQRDFT
jgi:hypothetical protein